MPGPHDQPDDASSDGRLPLPPELSPRGRSARRGGQSAAPPAPRSRGRRVARYASWTAVTASVLVLVLSGAAFAYYEHLNGNISRIPLAGRITGSRPAEAQDGAENILIVGDDSRVGETPAELRAEHTTNDGGALNTDTIIILHLAPNDGPATLVSIPRDSYVPIPGHGTFKINSAYADGENDKKGNGPALLTETVENLSGLHIDHFISVGLTQFINISNAIGGVKVCVVNPELTGVGQYDGGAYDKHYSGLELTKGVHTISGSTALAFVRQRHGLPDGDLDRIKRQQRFITAVEQKASATTNPATINQVLEKATSSLTVDQGLSGLALVKLAERLRGLKPAQIRFATVPVANENAVTYLSNGQEVSYVQLDMTRLKTFFANLQDERDPNAPAPTPTVSPAAPDQVTLTVENGAQQNGAAGQARTSLESYGFHVASIGDADTTSTTTIRYNPADAAAAVEVAKALPGATLDSDSTQQAGVVDLVLGTDYTGVHDPSAPVTSSPAPSASSSVSGGTTTAAGLVGSAGSIDGVPCGP